MADETTVDQADENTEEYPVGALVFRTRSHAGSWTSSEGDTYTDLTVVESPTEALVRDAAHAHAAGVLEIVQGVDTENLAAHGVQSQEDGEAAYEDAVASGAWQVGQDQQAALEAEARERGDATVVVDILEEEVPSDA